MPGHTTNHMKGPRVATAEDEDEAYGKTARALLKMKEFDPDNLNEEDENGMTPMLYFCVTGNLQMCRYLIAHGADCRKAVIERKS